jgi:succinyl-CoA synthetase alpha subunit
MTLFLFTSKAHKDVTILRFHEALSVVAKVKKSALKLLGDLRSGIITKIELKVGVLTLDKTNSKPANVMRPGYYSYLEKKA